jgi:hypothetical protein
MASTTMLVEDPSDPGTFILQTIEIPDMPVDPDSTYIPSEGLRDTRLSWNDDGERFFEAGVDRGVLYLDDADGVVWNGLISVDENPSGGEAVPYYIDGYKYAQPSSPEEFEATIEAYTYPREFASCDGTETMANGLFITQQNRKPFGLSYRTQIGNDVEGSGYGYKLHLVYNAQATPSQKTYSSFSDSTEALNFSWDITTRPKRFEDPSFGVKYGAHLVLDSTLIYPWAMEAVEKVLYGTAEEAARLPTPQELLELFVDNALLKITDNGDGTWTAEGPDSIISMLDSDTFEIDWPSATYVNATTFTISSL